MPATAVFGSEQKSACHTSEYMQHGTMIGTHVSITVVLSQRDKKCVVRER